MKYVLFAAVLLLLLAACDAQPMADQCAQNPKLCEVVGQELQRQETQTARAADYATQQAAAEIAAKATRDAATENEKSYARQTQYAVEGNATQTALAANVTMAALSQATQDASYTATSQAGTEIARPTQAVQTAQAAQITSTAIVQAATDAQNAAIRRDNLETVVLIAKIIGLVIGFYYVIRFIEFLLTRADRKSRLDRPKDGPPAGWELGPDGEYHWRYLEAHYRPLPSNIPINTRGNIDGVEPIGAGGVAWRGGAPKQNENQEQAIELVQAAINATKDEEARYIPRWDKLGMNSTKVQAIEGWMKAAGLIESQQGRPTHLVKHESLAHLLFELQEGFVKIPPSPPPARRYQ